MPTPQEIADALLSQYGGVPTMRDKAKEWIEQHQSRRTLQLYDVRRLNLAVAEGDLRVKFVGNVVSILHLEGAPAAQTPYLDVAFDSGGAVKIPIHSEITLTRDYDEVHMSWAALVGGYAVVLFGIDVNAI